LLPVAWIASLSLKQGDESKRSFLPHHWTFDNYRQVFDTSLFHQRLRNSIGIRSSTVLSVTLGRSRYAIARLEFKGRKLVLVRGAGHRHVPTVALVGAAVRHVAIARLYDTGWLVIPTCRSRCRWPSGRCGVLPPIPWSWSSGPGRRGDGVAGVPQGHRAVGRPRGLHGGHPHVLFAWNDFVLASR